MIQCTDCGMYLPESEEVCTKCGTPVASGLASEAPEGDKFQITKRKKIGVDGVVGMVLAAIGSFMILISVLHATNEDGGMGVLFALLMVISIILAVLGLVLFVVGAFTKGASAFVAVSFLSAFILGLTGFILIFFGIAAWTEAPVVSVALFLIVIGWIIGLVAGIRVVRYKPGPESTRVK